MSDQKIDEALHNNSNGKMKQILLAIIMVAALGVLIFARNNESGIVQQEESVNSCSLVNPSIEPSAKVLYKNLRVISKDHILFGHQDDLAYGVGWQYEHGRSDTKETTGSYPAVFGWDIGGIGLGMDKNLDSIPFDKMKLLIRHAYDEGGIITISWHTYNPISHKDSWTDKTRPDSTLSHLLHGMGHHQAYVDMLDKAADFLLDLRDKDNNLIPVFFRPFHENNGSWFWWGQKHCSPDQYKELYRFTVDYLINEREVNNLLFVYSPDRNFDNKEEYLERYPGDDYVDMIGYDDYYSFKIGDTDGIVKRLRIVTDLAEEKNKIAAFTETGFESLQDPESFTKTLLPLLKHDEKTRRIAWVLVWRNFDTKHHYVPYPGHHAEADFVDFRNDSCILFCDDLPDLYSEMK
jgi:mannan endo-1,4-beta-mannosidase